MRHAFASAMVTVVLMLGIDLAMAEPSTRGAKRQNTPILIFDPMDPAAAPTVLVPQAAPNAVPPAPIFLVEIGKDDKGKTKVLRIAEQPMILDQGKVAPVPSKQGKKRKSAK